MRQWQLKEMGREGKEREGKGRGERRDKKIKRKARKGEKDQ